MNLANALSSLYKDEAPALAGVAALLATADWRDRAMVTTKVDDLVNVYKVTCAVTGKAYIGITVNSLERRWAEHVRRAMATHSRRRFLQMIRKYGQHNFICEVICVAFGTDAAREIESLLIADHGTFSPAGYNASTGGEGGVGRRQSAEAKKNLSAAVKRTWADPDKRAKMVAAFQNRVIPLSHVEHLRQQAAAMKGKKRSSEAVAKGSASLKGHAVSDETRAKIRASKIGKCGWTDDRRAREAANRNRAFTDDEVSNIFGGKS